MSLKSGTNSSINTPSPDRRWSISRRLVTLYTASSLLVSGFAMVFLYWSLVWDVERDDNAFLANKIEECRRLLREGSPNDTSLLAHEVQTEAAASQFIKYYLRLLGADGTVELETPGMADAVPSRVFPYSLSIDERPVRGTIWKSPTGVYFSLLSTHTDDAAGKTLQVALDVSSDEALIRNYRWKLIAVACIGGLASWIAGIYVVRKGLSPLIEITRSTEQITAAQLDSRIAPEGWPVELKSLVKSFNQMLDRLEQSFKQLSQFSADLAHELRTPINNLRLEAGVIASQTRSPEEYRRAIESSLEEYARLSRLIENLLFLARADGTTAKLKTSIFNAGKAAEVVREYYESLAAEKKIELRCEGEATVCADPILFQQALGNLISNALNYTDSGGTIRVAVSKRKDFGTEIIVTDTGIGIAPEHVPRIFDRLYRADSARSQNVNGVGLGLALVKSIMTLHGGTVEVQSRIGSGSSFKLMFPAGKPAALS